MRRKIAVVALSLLAWLPVPLAFGDEAEARRAAEAYIDATGGFAAQLDTTIDALALRLPVDHQEPFKTFMHEALDPAEIEAVAIDGMVEHFTTEELTALADFYGSETGRRIAAKFPIFFADSMAEMKELIDDRANDFDP